jgi:hypothetical protein
LENTVGLWSGGFRTRGPNHFEANILNRYGTIRVEDAEADDVIRFENLPPQRPGQGFLVLACRGRFRRFVEQLD